MNGTTATADLLSRMSDARQRESESIEELRQILMRQELLQRSGEAELWRLQRVSNNLGVYFYFVCLVQLFLLVFSGVLCELCKQACLSLFYVAKFGRFLCTTCLDTRQPGTVFKKLDTRQSEILTNFLEIARLIPLRT